MRLASVRFRTFVHATEDEDRVRKTLLWTMGVLGEKDAEHRIDRKPLKGHYGNTILLLEAVLKSERAAEPSLRRLVDEPGVQAELRETLARRLDEDNVLHLRVDKQEAVLRRLRLTEEGDAIVVQAKGVAMPGENAVTAWAKSLAGAPTNL